MDCHPADILPETRHHNFCHSVPYLLLKTGPTPKRTKTIPHVNENITTINPITQRYFQHTLNHTAPSPLFPQTGLGDRRSELFQSGYSKSNHRRWNSHFFFFFFFFYLFNFDVKTGYIFRI